MADMAVGGGHPIDHHSYCFQDYPAINQVYAEFFSKETAPARAAYQVGSWS